MIVKGVDEVESAERERRKDEKIDGVVYSMSPVPDYRHSIINNNINTIIKQGLKNSLCLVFMENLDYKYHPDINDDYFCPDIMIVCGRKELKGGAYSGVPKFIAETLSPSTAKRDKTVKKDAYEKAGIEEYWIVAPNGILEIYYLVDGKYVLEQNYILQADQEEADYNADTTIALRAFPNITMTLKDVFENVD